MLENIYYIVVQMAEIGGISVQRSFKKNVTQSQLERDDFDGGPVSLDEIEPGLWLGIESN